MAGFFPDPTPSKRGRFVWDPVGRCLPTTEAGNCKEDTWVTRRTKQDIGRAHSGVVFMEMSGATWTQGR